MKHNIVADSAALTHKKIKAQNKLMSQAKNRTEKDIIQANIDQAKADWWEENKELFRKD